MNERIRDLWNQSRYPSGRGHDEEKFAELIVRECAKVLTQHGAYFSGDGEPYHYAASLIEAHFGVEE